VASSAWCQSFGFTQSQLVGLNITDVMGRLSQDGDLQSRFYEAFSSMYRIEQPLVPGRQVRSASESFADPHRYKAAASDSFGSVVGSFSTPPRFDRTRQHATSLDEVDACDENCSTLRLHTKSPLQESQKHNISPISISFARTAPSQTDRNMQHRAVTVKLESVFEKSANCLIQEDSKKRKMSASELDLSLSAFAMDSINATLSSVSSKCGGALRAISDRLVEISQPAVAGQTLMTGPVSQSQASSVCHTSMSGGATKFGEILSSDKLPVASVNRESERYCEVRGSLKVTFANRSSMSVMVSLCPILSSSSNPNDMLTCLLFAAHK
jgi:hypothetical protein